MRPKGNGDPIVSRVARALFPPHHFFRDTFTPEQGSLVGTGRATLPSGRSRLDKAHRLIRVCKHELNAITPPAYRCAEKRASSCP